MEKSGRKMCEYFTNVEETRGFIDKKIDNLKQVLDKRQLVLNWRLDKICSDSRNFKNCIGFRLDWFDKEIHKLIRNLGNVEVETGTINAPIGTDEKDSVFRTPGVERSKDDSDYMIMRRPTRSESVTDVPKATVPQEVSLFDTSRDSMDSEPEEITSQVTNKPQESFSTDGIQEELDDIYIPMAKWESVEQQSDPIYEIIDEKSLKKIAGIQSEKNRRKKISPVYDLPVIAKCPQGKRLGQLDKPKGVAVCPKGRIFVAEKGNNRVQVFDSEANFITSFGEKSGSNKMISPYGIFIREDTVYVTLTGQHCIQMYTCQGVFVREKGRQGKEEGRLKSPTGIDGDKVRGKVLVCDTGNNRIQLFDKDLKFIKVIRTTILDRPLDVKVAKLGDFIVLDRSQTFLHLFNSFGELLSEIIDNRICLKIINPLFFTLSPQGDVILSDFSNHCVYVFASDRSISWTLGEEGKGRPLEEPRGLVCDERGRLITVSNKKMDCLQIFEL